MRRVRWLRSDVSRDAFRQDLLYSFGAFMTVCEITRNDALSRVESVARSGRDPGYEASAVARPAAVPTNDAPSAEEADKELDKLARGPGSNDASPVHSLGTTSPNSSGPSSRRRATWFA